MKNTKIIISISIIGVMLLLFSSAFSILNDDGGSEYNFTSIHGQDVNIYGGEGPYRFDNVNKAVMFRGFDIINIVIIVPIFILGIIFIYRKNIKGVVVLLSCNVYLTYNYLIGVMGNSFNELFLIWTALFSIGIWGALIILHSLKQVEVFPLFDDKFPRKTMIGYMVVLAVFLFSSYLIEVISSYAYERVPLNLQHYTTLELAALELGIMVPLHVIAAILLIKKQKNGSLLSLVLSFTALMTFLALTTYSILNFFQYNNGAISDILIPVILSVVSGYCTIVGLIHLNKKIIC